MMCRDGSKDAADESCCVATLVPYTCPAMRLPSSAATLAAGAGCALACWLAWPGLAWPAGPGLFSLPAASLLRHAG